MIPVRYIHLSFKTKHVERLALFVLLWSSFFLLVGSISTMAQSGIRFERINVEDGLSQSAITSMVQDKYGYLWIGTLDGLNRYDGNSFTIYRDDQDRPGSFPSHSVGKLFMDANQNLWVSYRNGLSLYEPEHDKFKSYKIQIDERNCFIRDFDQTSDSLILLSTNLGVLEFNHMSGKLSTSNLYSDFKNQNTYGVASANSMTWLFTDSCIWRKNSRDSLWFEFFRNDNQVRCTYFENSNELYVRTESELLKYDSIHDTLALIESLPKDQWPVSFDMLRTKDGNLWIAHGGISIFDSNDRLSTRLVHTPQDPNSLSGPFVSDIYETRDGVVWVGTNGLGLNKYNPSRSVFRYVGNFPGAPLTLADNYITSVYTDDDKTILVNTLDGLNVIDIQRQTSRHFPIIGKNKTEGRVLKVFADARGKVWLATNRGLMSFEGNTIGWSGNEFLNSPDLAIYDAVVIDKSEILFTTSKGLLVWNEDKNKISIIHDVGSLVLMKAGHTIWFETGEKLRIMQWKDKKIVKTFPVNGSDFLHAPLASIKCIFQDTDKNIWLGTDGGGLSLYDSATQTFQHFQEADGLGNNVVYGITEDEAGNLWMSTNEGISVFNRKTKEFVRTFNKADGLQGNEFNTRAYFRSQSGKMYFGGVNGLSFFDPAQALNIPSLTPQTVLTGFYINNIKQTVLGSAQVSKLFSEHQIELEWHQRNFSFDVAGLGFTFPSGIQYQYQLEGFDKGWNLNGNQSRITFTNIPAGHYTLFVKSGNSFGDWEEQGLAIKIVVISPFWMSSWFIAAALALIILLIFYVNFQRTLFLKRRASILQNLVDQRTREIQIQQEEIATQNEELTAQAEALENSNAELEKRVEGRTMTLQRLNEDLVEKNTQLEQFTFITAHNIKGPIARIKGLINLLKPQTNNEIVHHLETSTNTLDDVINNLNAVLNITHGINKKFEVVSVRELLVLVIETLREEISSINATVDTSEFEDVKLVGMKAYFQSVFYNLIHNALKYSDTQRQPYIKCYSRITEDGTQIIVEDNGVGIDMRYARDKIFKLHQRFHPNTVGKGYGLFLVNTQVKVMGGKIEVESELDRGTKFIISFFRADNLL